MEQYTERITAVFEQLASNVGSEARLAAERLSEQQRRLQGDLADLAARKADMHQIQVCWATQ